MDEKKAPERIILGSGYIHLATFKKGQTIPEPQDFCTKENRYSYIKNGATLEYTNEVQEAKDDMGQVSKTVITSEEVTLKAGLMTLIGDTIEKLCDTARVSVSQDGKYRKTKIGGVGNRKGAKYVICFHHVDPEDGDIWVMIVGQNQAGFTLSFAPSDATVVDAEFKAMPNLDEEGTLVDYVEEILTDGDPDPETYKVEQNLTKVSSTFAGTTIGKTDDDADGGSGSHNPDADSHNERSGHNGDSMEQHRRNRHDRKRNRGRNYHSGGDCERITGSRTKSDPAVGTKKRPPPDYFIQEKKGKGSDHGKLIF